MKIILVTGTPGVGKTTLSKALSKKSGYSYVDLTSFISEKGLSAGFDDVRGCDLVDLSALGRSLKVELSRLESTGSKGVIIDSHMAQDLGITPSLCVVVTCPLPELKSRLESRGYSSEKVRENLDCEIFDTSYIDSVENGLQVQKVSGLDLNGSVDLLIPLI